MHTQKVAIPIPKELLSMIDEMSNLTLPCGLRDWEQKRGRNGDSERVCLLGGLFTRKRIRLKLIMDIV